MAAPPPGATHHACCSGWCRLPSPRRVSAPMPAPWRGGARERRRASPQGAWPGPLACMRGGGGSGDKLSATPGPPHAKGVQRAGPAAAQGAARAQPRPPVTRQQLQRHAVAVVWQQRRVWRHAGPLGSRDRPRRAGPAGARGGGWGQGGCAAGPLRRTAAAPLSHPFPSAPAPRLRPGPTPQGQSRPTRTRRLAGQARPRGNGARAARPSHRNSCNATAVAVVLRQRRAWRDPARELHFGP